jgi:hypothetical protein
MESHNVITDVSPARQRPSTMMPGRARYPLTLRNELIAPREKERGVHEFQVSLKNGYQSRDSNDVKIVSEFSHLKLPSMDNINFDNTSNFSHSYAAKCYSIR